MNLIALTRKLRMEYTFPAGAWGIKPDTPLVPAREAYATLSRIAMPKKVHSAARRARSDARKRARNQVVRTRVRTGLRAFLTQAKSDPKGAAPFAYRVISLADRAAKSGVIHRNAADRLKARVMARLATR